MPRYVVRNHVRQRPYYDTDDSVLERAPETITVNYEDRGGFTGLYNEHGSPLYRERESFGFKVRD